MRQILVILVLAGSLNACSTSPAVVATQAVTGNRRIASDDSGDCTGLCAEELAPTRASEHERMSHSRD